MSRLCMSLLCAAAAAALLLAAPAAAKSHHHHHKHHRSNSGSSMPVFYVIFHGGSGSGAVNNVYSYDLDGNQLSDSVLQGDADIDELRSAILLPGGDLLIANAHDTDSRITRYGSCGSDGTRTFTETFASDHLSHPYGLAYGLDVSRGNATTVWATNQDTDDLVAFSASNGSFVEVVKNFGTDQLRSAAYDEQTGVLYVANEDQDTVLAYDTRKGAFDDSLSFTDIGDPIGLYIDYESRTLFVGSHGGSSNSTSASAKHAKHSVHSKSKSASDDDAVYAYDLDSRKLLQTYTHKTLSHPAGLVSFGGALYVLSQKEGLLLQFDVQSGEYVQKIISDFPDTVEQILLSPC